MNKLADMSTFVAVVEAGSLTAAARRVGTTKSVISQRIRQLESRLGIGLVERAGKLRVTDAGRELHEHDGLLYAHRESSGMWQLPVDGEMRSFRIRARMRTDNGYQMLDAARAGLGLVILPTFLAADAIVAGDLVPVLSDFSPSG